MRSNKINLPETLNGWRLDAPPRRIDKTNIFDYMDGAGELYLSYEFDHLLVYEYKTESDNDILVELYQMKDSQDAFGLLSLDWGGEPVDLNHLRSEMPENSASPQIIPKSRALYGKGLLRIWSDDLYIRIMAFKDTPGVKEVILKLGKIITVNRSNPSPPEMLQVIKPSADSSWSLRKDRTAYFYSHLVLNSLFYISHENILNLSHSTEAVFVTYYKKNKDGARQSPKLLVIKYPEAEQAAVSLKDFIKTYLPDQGREMKQDPNKEIQQFFQIEDGWMGFKLFDRTLSLVFECPDSNSAQEILSQVQ
ncbi:MAG: hypothetical protein JXB26_00715 [Candidatus Aminicenantes bacterium]|nr:hypothetical protein [Candidatus Aminicenantes bacterium]